MATSDSRHTPGPWFVDQTGNARQFSVRARLQIARLCITKDSILRDEGLANAHLIAAAPDLLNSLDPETLEAVADEIDCFEHSARAASLRGIAKRQRLAISRALLPQGGPADGK